MSFLLRLRPAVVYASDPGAVSVFTELVPMLQSAGRFCGWYTDGWASGRIRGSKPKERLLEALTPGSGLILGSQTNFTHTQALLSQAAARSVETTFIFDHWKNFAEHFGNGPLPTHIVVPDAAAFGLLVKALGPLRRTNVIVLPHLAISAAAARIKAMHGTLTPGLIAMLLDPTELYDGLGYDWRSAITVAFTTAADLSAKCLQIKPHPRQDPMVIANYLLSLPAIPLQAQVYTGGLEALIARAEEVWGMTTIGLNIALAAGKAVRSFQPRRTEAGLRASNPHIEPLLHLT